jgi:SAM-dependent methyltransferase
MRVLDLGCGRGVSSVFLRREYGVEVWATDLWFSPTERLERVRDAGVDDGVFPIFADARSLPFANEFFDAIVSIDAFPYWGTDDLYANYVTRFLKPGAAIGIAGSGLVRELAEAVPPALRHWWEPSMSCLHSPEWWSRHWQRSGVLDVEVADSMPDGWQLWLEWQRAVSPDNLTEIEAVEADAGHHLGYVRAVARRRPDGTPDEPIGTIPVEYTTKPLLRERSEPGA